MAFKMRGFTPYTKNGNDESTNSLVEKKTDLEIKIEGIMNDSDDEPNSDQQNLINNYRNQINDISKKLENRGNTNIKPIYNKETGKRIGSEKYK